MLNATTRKRLEKAQKGQSLIELAISMVILTMIISAVIDLGRVWFSYIALEDAAGEAALFLTIFPYCGDADDLDPSYPGDPTFCADPDNAAFRAQHAMGNDFIGFNWNQVTFEPNFDPVSGPGCSNVYVVFEDCLTWPPYIQQQYTVRMKYDYYLISPFVPVVTAGSNRIELWATASQQIIRRDTSD